MKYPNHCEEKVEDVGVLFRSCRGRGLTINVHPDGHTRVVLCKQHSRKAMLSGYKVDWDETAKVFPATKRSGGDRVKTKIGDDA